MTTSTLPTIWLVDDDRIYQFTAKRIIELLNPKQKVEVFSNGKEAIDYILQSDLNTEILPDIILLDLNMPVMNGWEFLEAFHDVHPSIEKPICIYMVSSSVDERDKLRCKTYSAVKDFIEKPLDQQLMVNIIQAPSATSAGYAA